MTNPENDLPRLSDALNGDGFPALGPRTDLSDAVLDDALERLRESGALIAPGGGLCPETHIPEIQCSCGANAESAAAYAERVKANRRAAKEIEAAHADLPNWPLKDPWPCSADPDWPGGAL